MNMKPTSLLTLALAFFAMFGISCSGQECSASKTIVSDRDSDCIEDASDNCFDVYNPNQEDTDEDEIGDACEDTAVFMARTLTYNLAGYFEATQSDCATFTSLDITQNGSTLTATGESNEAFFGKILSKPNDAEVSAVLENESWFCDMIYTLSDTSYRLDCESKSAATICTASGQRLTTRTETP